MSNASTTDASRLNAARRQLADNDATIREEKSTVAIPAVLPSLAHPQAETARDPRPQRNGAPPSTGAKSVPGRPTDLPDEELEDLCLEFQDMIGGAIPLVIKRDFSTVRHLGRGRQGVVVEATDEGAFGCVTRHALKLFNPELFLHTRDYEEDLRRIARQTRVLQRHPHPSLVHCTAFYCASGIGILVMELVEGMDLHNFLDFRAHERMQRKVPATLWEHFNDVIFATGTRRIQPGVAMYLLREILRGLEMLHRIGYIHCDVKPSNIMIDRFSSVKLIDFGRAAAVNDTDGPFLGSPLYMAPELHRRQGPPTVLVDLYSAGFLTTELLYGDHLISTDASDEEILAFKESLPGRLENFLPPAARSDAQLVRLLKSLLAVNPAERFQSANQAAELAFSIHRSLAQMKLDADYRRELELYLEHRLPPLTEEGHTWQLQQR